MATIYKTTDQIPLKVKDLTIKVSPLSFEQKMKVQSEILKNGAEGAMRGAKLACQFAIKEIKGIVDGSGNEYQIELKDGKLSDECWDDLQNVQETQDLITVCLNLINGVPKEFIDPQTGKKLEGVSFVKKDNPGKKK